jgi:hypothetical protein
MIKIQLGSWRWCHGSICLSLYLSSFFTKNIIKSFLFFFYALKLFKWCFPILFSSISQSSIAFLNTSIVKVISTFIRLQRKYKTLIHGSWPFRQQNELNIIHNIVLKVKSWSYLALFVVWFVMIKPFKEKRVTHKTKFIFWRKENWSKLRRTRNLLIIPSLNLKDFFLLSSNIMPGTYNCSLVEFKL